MFPPERRKIFTTIAVTPQTREMLEEARRAEGLTDVSLDTFIIFLLKEREVVRKLTCSRSID